MRLWRILAALAAVCFAVAAEASVNVEYILDSSNSMNETLPSGEKKIDAAKRILCNLVDNIAAEAKDVKVGLRIYGANFDPAQTKETACMDSVLVVPILPINVSKIKQAVVSAAAAGYTPIAYSLELGSRDFPSGKSESNAIVLVSDGQETCGGDPVAVAEKLREQGFNIKIYTIGFAVNKATRKQLEDIASVTGGQYYDAKDADQLEKALEEVKMRTYEEYQSAGEKVEPSRWIINAPEIETGEYKGKIAMQEALFYKIKVYKGQMVKATFIVKKTPYNTISPVSNNQIFAVKLFDNLFKEVAFKSYVVKGNPDQLVSFKTQWNADRTGWVYIVISATKNEFLGLPKEISGGGVAEPSSYTLKVKTKGDVLTGKSEKFVSYTVEEDEGGTGFGNAHKITSGIIYSGSIYMDEMRFYKFSVPEGVKKIKVSALVRKPWYRGPISYINLEMVYSLKIYDEDWAELASKDLTIKLNPPEPFSFKAESDTGGNDEIYISLSASKNREPKYPKQKPPAERYSIMLMEE